MGSSAAANNIRSNSFLPPSAIAISATTRLLPQLPFIRGLHDLVRLEKKTEFATNLIIIEAKKVGSTDTSLGQLTAYMGLVHAYRKGERKQNCIVYGATSDGFSFRFCRIDNNGNWSQTRLLEWGMGDQSKI